MKLIIAKDKQLHFIICAVISLLVGIIFRSVIAGMFIALYVGMLKELYDVSVKKSEWDIYDLLADLVGGIVGVIGYLLIVIFIK